MCLFVVYPPIPPSLIQVTALVQCQPFRYLVSIGFASLRALAESDDSFGGWNLSVAEEKLGVYFFGGIPKT